MWAVTCRPASAADHHTGSVQSWPATGPGVQWVPTHCHAPVLMCGHGRAVTAPAPRQGVARGVRQGGPAAHPDALTPPQPRLTSQLCLAPPCSAHSPGMRPCWSCRRRSHPACSTCSITRLRPEKAPACTGVLPSRQRLQQNDENSNGLGKGRNTDRRCRMGGLRDKGVTTIMGGGDQDGGLTWEHSGV